MGPGPSGRTSVLCSTAAHRRWIDAQAAARGFDAADEAEARASAGITATASGRSGRGRGAGDRTGAGPGGPPARAFGVPLPSVRHAAGFRFSGCPATVTSVLFGCRTAPGLVFYFLWGHRRSRQAAVEPAPTALTAEK
ncbi:hypothetical protein ACWEQ2_23175 [Streptomyces sp. NPDC004096]